MTSSAPSDSPLASPPRAEVSDRAATAADAPAAARALADRARAVGRGWLEGYAQILFGHRPLGGLLAAAATFVVPAHGLAGLLGLLTCNLWARALGRPAEHIAEGYYGYNGLLVGLALGLYFRVSPAFVLLVAVVSLLTVVIAAAARNLTDRYLGVPVLSLPFVFATWAALLAARRFAGVEIALDPVLVTDIGAGLLPQWIELYLRSLAATFFQLSVLSGALVFAALLVLSRWATLLSILGFATGAAVYVGLGGRPSDLYVHLIGFNFVLVPIAVGGIYVVLGPPSMLLAAAAGALAAVVSAALLALLEPFALPVLSLPLIAVIQLLLFALLTRTRSGPLQLVVGAASIPEDNLARATFRARRYPDPAIPVLHLPVMGRWLVTQGPDGEHTHKGLWSHAWDFEVTDDDGRRHRQDGSRPEDWLAWAAPVIAPGAGRVVRVIDHLDDNPVGEVDTANNWGNLIILWHHGDVYSALCHLQKGSVSVREGETVVRGQLLARVGSSGRSPVPHLHFQVQGSAAVGAPTRRADLLHYLTGERSTGYVTHGVPATGDLVRALPIDAAAREAVLLPPGTTYRWTIQAQGDAPAREERWQSTIDALGARHLVVVDDSGGGAAGDGARPNRAAFYLDDHYLTVLDYEGRSDTLLGVFSLASARLPLTADATVTWTDTPSARPFLSPPARLAVELLLPFAEVGAARTAAGVTPHPRGLRLTSTLDVGGAARALPDRVEVIWARGAGPVELRAWRDDALLFTAERQTP